MIIRRMASAIRRQDWFQVIVEILIVVIGIFIGLQVTEWNEQRKDRQQLDIAFDRLLNETRDNLELLITTEKVDDETRVSVLRGFKMLINCNSQENEGGTESFNEILQFTKSTRNIIINQTALDNLRKNELYTSLMKPETLSAINDYYFKIARILRETNFNEELAWANIPFRQDTIMFSENGGDGLSGFDTVLKAPLSEVCMNDGLTKSLYDYLAYISLKVESINLLIEETESLLSLVDQQQL